jgi:hypothetical protein
MDVDRQKERVGVGVDDGDGGLEAKFPKEGDVRVVSVGVRTVKGPDDSQGKIRSEAEIVAELKIAEEEKVSAEIKLAEAKQKGMLA